ncbi:MAG: hypothetical protein AABX69_02670, partial [Nanoarchaeota archaeon]
MAEMAWGNIQSAAIMLAVVIISLTVAKEPIVHASENTAKVFGIDIGKPKIGSFTASLADTASPAEAGQARDMNFKLSIAGNTADTVLEVYQSKDQENLAELTAPDYPLFDTKHMVLKLCGKGVSETYCPPDALKSGVLMVTCPKMDDAKGCLKVSETYKPGWYRFAAVLRKGGKTVYQSETKAGFYNEEYLEGLHQRIPNCDECDVRECKRIQLKELLEKKDKCTEGVKILYKQSGAPFGGKSGNCQYPVEPKGQTDPFLETQFSGCDASQIDSAHSKAALPAFYRAACENGEKIWTLNDLPNMASKLA